MKNLSWLIFTVFSILFLASCGGNENEAAQEEGETDGENISVSFRTAGDAECTGMELGCLRTQMTAVSFQIKDSNGETVFQKLMKSGEIKSKMKFTGIKNTENATLLVSVFGKTDGVEDLDNPKWEGKATGLNFEEGKTTSVLILLYPKEVQSKEISMPEGLIIPRFGHTSTVLADGRILIAGGFTACYSNGKCPATETVEIIDLESGKVETLSTSMIEKRAMHTAIALKDGSVLFIGGVQTLGVNLQEESFPGYPQMRFVPSTASVTIEKYMPLYPKYNMKTNDFGTPIDNTSESVITSEEIPFSAFQSVITERVSENQIDVFLVGGLDEKGKPSGKSYKFTITESEDGTVSVGDLEELKESSEPMLLPALAYRNGSIIAAGGRPTDSKYGASIISKSESTDFGTAKDNTFFMKGLSMDGNLYTFGGYGIKDGSLAESNFNKISKWNASGVETAETGLLTYSNNIVFPEVIYDNKNKRFLVIGGTNAANIQQVVDPETLKLQKDQSHTMTDKRIMPSAVIVPEGLIGDKPAIVITGGTSALDSTGSAVKTIKINNL